jgi:hypothetical protein
MSSFYWEQILVCHLKRAKQTETCSEMEKLREMENQNGPKWQVSQTQLAHLASNL